LLSLEVPEDGLDFNAEVDAFERVLITKALERTGWVKNQAAALLRLEPDHLSGKDQEKGIIPPGGGHLLSIYEGISPFYRGSVK
jgi:DNA-binding NtrC family response regulator